MELNYAKNSKEDIPFAQYMEEYRRIDPAEAALRTGIPYDEERRQFTLRMLHREYRVSWPDFEVVCMDGQDGVYGALENETAAKILALRFLEKGIRPAAVSNMITYRDTPWGEVYYRQFQGRCMMRLAFSYGNCIEKFREVCEAVGAVSVGAGDAAYQFEIFQGYPVQFLLWAGDDEFPPSSQILFGDNMAAAFHGEDLVVICDVILGTLKHAAGQARKKQ